MATGLKLTIFVLLFEWTKNILPLVELTSLLSVFQWMAVLSVLFGNIIALLQKDLKRMLLFSTVAHSGLFVDDTYCYSKWFLHGKGGFILLFNDIYGYDFRRFYLFKAF